MNAMLGFLAVVVVLAGATSAGLLVFSKENFKSLQLTDDPEPVELPAVLINSLLDMEYEVVRETSNTFLLEKTGMLGEPEMDHDVCKGNFGVEITNGPTACNIKHIRIKITKENKIHSIQLELDFEESDTTPLVKIITPVMRLPAEYEELSPPELTNWARDVSHVGLWTTSPVDGLHLFSIVHEIGSGLSFMWLKGLLNHGSFKLKDSSSFNVVVTRPILMPKSYEKRFFRELGF